METSNKKVKIKVFESAKKIIVTFLVMGINFGGLSAVLGTSAYFSDMEVSTDNAFNAATLDFAAQHSWSFHPYSTCDPKEEICPGWDLTDTVSLATAGTLDFQYTISIVNAAETASSTLPLCDNLTVNGVPLKSFAAGPVQHSTSSVQALVFSLTGDDAALQDQTCNFDYLIRGWQTDGVAGYGQGFFVEKIIGSSITSDPWMVEVPAVESETGGEDEMEEDDGEGGDTGGGSAGVLESEDEDIDDTADSDGQIQEQGEENQEGEGEDGAEDSGEGDSADNDDPGDDSNGSGASDADDAVAGDGGGDQNAGTDGGGQTEGGAGGESAGGEGQQQGSDGDGGSVDMGQATVGGNESAGGGDGGNADGDGDGGAGSGDAGGAGDGGQGSGDTGGDAGGAGGDTGGAGEGGVE